MPFRMCPGEGKVGFGIEGQIHGETVSLSVPIHNIPTLPFSPGKHLELQQGSTIYRCLPEDGRLAMKYIHMVKSFYELRNETAAPECVG